MSGHRAEHLREAIEVRAPTPEKIDVARWSVWRLRPEMEEHGPLEDELGCVLRAPYPVEQALHPWALSRTDPPSLSRTGPAKVHDL